MSAIEWLIFSMHSIFHPFHTWFSVYRLNIIVTIMRNWSVILDAINVPARSIYNNFEVKENGLIGLFSSLEMTIKCFFKPRSKKISSISQEFFIVSIGSINVWLKTKYALRECWAVKLCILKALANFLVNCR